MRTQDLLAPCVYLCEVTCDDELLLPVTTSHRSFCRYLCRGIADACNAPSDAQNYNLNGIRLLEMKFILLPFQAYLPTIVC